MTSLLSFAGVTVRRGGNLLFEGLDLELRGGEALQIGGPNGCGKSSLIRVAAGLLAATSGRVERSATALADDAIGLDRELPLCRALLFWGRSPERAMETLGLGELGEIPVRMLSSGQLKRAILARVASSGAPLWLLDEPLNGLDMQGEERLAELVAGHMASGGAVLAASHQALTGHWRRLELGR